MNYGKEEARFLGYAQALEEFSIMFAKIYEEDKPDTPEKVREMVIDILDEHRVSCVRKLGFMSITSHPIWID
jgi:hypothetical protein